MGVIHRAITGDCENGCWRLEIPLGLMLGPGNAFGVESATPPQVIPCCCPWSSSQLNGAMPVKNKSACHDTSWGFLLDATDANWNL